MKSLAPLGKIQLSNLNIQLNYQLIKKINKKLQMGKITRKKLIVDEQRIKGVELCKTKPESSNNFTIRSSSLDISGMNQL